MEPQNARQTLRCHSPRTRGTQYSAASGVSGSPAFGAVKDSHLRQAGSTPCAQGILQRIFYGSPCHQVIRMPLYATAAMTSGHSLRRTGRDSGETRREILCNGRDFRNAAGKSPPEAALEFLTHSFAGDDSRTISISCNFMHFGLEPRA